MERLNESRIIGAVLTDAFAVRASPSTVSTLHAAHGTSLLVGLDSEVTVQEPGRAPVRGRAVLVPPHQPHAVTGPGTTLGFLYDPERNPRLAGFARQRGGAVALEGPLALRLAGAMAAHRASLATPEVLEGLAHEYAGWIGGETPFRGIDRRVARVSNALRAPTADRRLIAAQSGLSPAHLQALFVRDVGLPIRTFQLWHRLLAALSAFAHRDATDAAHAAGFADLAHFSRTCRRMLGYSPTVLRQGRLVL
ncbi:AraC-type DNA-binding protein [Stigmatella aurantiaca]|uniref:AraC-type DNA-binding protein n=1 Tax=Stigmatella aurantiaca TaxID=41 RepID=A0A1H7SPN7_STIAU|nr:helix-turn-helix domain-containing protein [Stigmatella aurantiaca]SEL73437.1 AraC-type DNA-binding protein [Stigmatella aurantiaca]